MEHHTTLLLTNPVTGVKRINPGYPGAIGGAADIASILDTRVSDKFTPEQAYVQSGWFRRCVDVRADALASIPYTLQRDGEPVYDSSGFDPLPSELAWLGDLETLLKLTEASLVVTGAAYWVPQVRRGRPRSIDWVSPLLIEPEYDERGNIVSYKRTRYQPSGSAVVPIETRIGAEFVVSFYWRDPFTEVGPGHAPGWSARTNADVLHSLDTFLDQYMDRGLLPATLIAVPANTSPEERNRLQQWWDKYYRGKHRAGTQKVINADAVKVEKLGDGIGQLGSSEIVNQQREAIASALGVPMSLLLPGAANRATSLQDEENLYTKTVIPEAKRLQAEMNAKLFADYGLYFAFEFKRIPALQRVHLETSRSVQRLVEKPVLTQNEARAIIGHRPVEDESADSLDTEAVRDLSNEASTLAVQEASTDPRPKPQSSDETVTDEIAKWHRKASSKGRDVNFVCENIPPRIEAHIRHRLRIGEELGKCFAPPFVDF